MVFVPFTAPGDEVEVNLLKKHKNYSEGEIARIVKPSALRVPPPCPVFQKCGGCSWQHLPYTLQFETKKKGLLHALNRAKVPFSSAPIDEMPASAHYGYRNRIQLRGNSTLKTIGFYSRRENTIVPISHCPITRKEINDVLPGLAEKGFRMFEGDFKLEIEVLPNGDTRYQFNEPHAAFGFRQVNDEQNEKLKAWIQSHVSPASLLLDLFGGEGNLSRPLLSQFNEIRCIDTAIGNGKAPAPHFRFERKDILKWARSPETHQDYAKTTSVICDPPREGLGVNFDEIEAKISNYQIKSIILVGCDVDSFVKDCSHFTRQGYRLARLGILDLFPQTPHLESLGLFLKEAVN